MPARNSFETAHLGENRFGTYPIDGAEVHSFSKVEALVEAAVISSGKGDHKLPSTLVGSVHLGGQTGQRQLTPKHSWRLQGEHGFPTRSNFCEDFREFETISPRITSGS